MEKVMTAKQLEREEVKRMKRKIQNKRPVVLGNDLSLLGKAKLSHEKQHLVVAQG